MDQFLFVPEDSDIGILERFRSACRVGGDCFTTTPAASDPSAEATKRWAAFWAMPSRSPEAAIPRHRPCA